MTDDWRLNGEQLALKRAREAERQRDRLLGVVSAHEAEKAHGLTANMDYADEQLYDAAKEVESEVGKR